MAKNAVTATQEAVNRGYDLGLLEESATKNKDFDSLPWSIMQDPIAGDGEGAVVDLNNKPLYTTTGNGHVYPYMLGRHTGTGDLDEDELQTLYKHLLNKNKT